MRIGPERLGSVRSGQERSGAARSGPERSGACSELFGAFPAGPGVYLDVLGRGRSYLDRFRPAQERIWCGRSGRRSRLASSRGQNVWRRCRLASCRGLNHPPTPKVI